MAKARVDLRLDPELLAEVDQAARAIGATRTEFVEQACRHAIDETASDARPVPPPPPVPSDPGVGIGADDPNAKRERAARKAKRKATPARKATQRPHSVATANRSAAGNRPLERRETSGKCPHPARRVFKGQCQACGEYVGDK